MGASLSHLRLRIAPNPARGPVDLRGEWENADGSPGSTLGTTARFRVYDASGRLVKDLGEIQGSLVARWDGTDRAGVRVAPGLYFAEVIVGGKCDARPLTFLP